MNIGDIGKKMGRDGIDNGWIQFTNVSIPRGYMLQKHTKVSRSGEVVEPKLQQLVSSLSKAENNIQWSYVRIFFSCHLQFSLSRPMVLFFKVVLPWLLTAVTFQRRH